MPLLAWLLWQSRLLGHIGWQDRICLPAAAFHVCAAFATAFAAAFAAAFSS